MSFLLICHGFIYVSSCNYILHPHKNVDRKICSVKTGSKSAKDQFIPIMWGAMTAFNCWRYLGKCLFNSSFKMTGMTDQQLLEIFTFSNYYKVSENILPTVLALIEILDHFSKTINDWVEDYFCLFFSGFVQQHMAFELIFIQK